MNSATLLHYKTTVASLSFFKLSKQCRQYRDVRWCCIVKNLLHTYWVVWIWYNSLHLHCIHPERYWYLNTPLPICAASHTHTFFTYCIIAQQFLISVCDVWAASEIWWVRAEGIHTFPAVRLPSRVPPYSGPSASDGNTAAASGIRAAPRQQSDPALTQGNDSNPKAPFSLPVCKITVGNRGWSLLSYSFFLWK